MTEDMKLLIFGIICCLFGIGFAVYYICYVVKLIYLRHKCRKQIRDFVEENPQNPISDELKAEYL